MAKRVIRPIRIEGQDAFVPLTQGYEAIIDAADVPLVRGFNWHAMVSRRKDGSAALVYAARRDISGGNGPKTLMHRVIDGTPSGMETDHRDGDGLNNRRGNLRPATSAQNKRNTRLRVASKSGVKGVAWSRQRSKWRARISVDGRDRHLGWFSALEAAASAYAAANADLHGDFGRLR